MHAAVAAAKAVYRHTLDLVFPRACLACARGVEESDSRGLRHLCGPCQQQLFVVQEPHCGTCGHPFYGEVAENRLCEHCEALVPNFDSGKTAILLRGAGRSLVHTLKYHHGLHVLDDITALMRRAPGYAEFVAGKVLVPVPPRMLKVSGPPGPPSMIVDASSRPPCESVTVTVMV